MQDRVCKDCGLSKSITAFRTPIGRKCIDCLDARIKARSKRYYQENSEYIKARVNQRRLDNLELDRERKQREYQENSEYIKARSQRHRDNNPENIKAMSKRYYTQRGADIKSRMTLYYQANQDSIKASVRNYTNKFPEKVRALAHKRRTQKTQAGGFFTDKEWVALKEQYGFSCLCCYKKEPEIKLTADHIVPVSKGGTSNIDNIQPLCKSCNCKKHDKIIDYRTNWEGDLRA